MYRDAASVLYLLLAYLLTLTRYMRTQLDNIKMGLKGIKSEGLIQINLAENMDKCPELGNTLMNILLS
jgi:hypothetical protein